MPLAYSQGFNPHPILSLACPRPVGVAARDDLAVIELTEPIGPEELLARLNRHVPEGMRFHRARPLDRTERPRPRRVRYEWPIAPGRREALRRKVREFRLAARWPLERPHRPKRRRSNAPPRQLELKTLVPEISVEGDTLSWTLAPAGDLWARPAEVLDALGLDGQVDLADAVRAEVDYGLADAPPPSAEPPS